MGIAVPAISPSCPNLARLKCPGCGTDDGSSRRRKKSDPVGAILEGIGVKKKSGSRKHFSGSKKIGINKKNRVR